MQTQLSVSVCFLFGLAKMLNNECFIVSYFLHDSSFAHKALLKEWLRLIFVNCFFMDHGTCPFMGLSWLVVFLNCKNSQNLIHFHANPVTCLFSKPRTVFTNTLDQGLSFTALDNISIMFQTCTYYFVRSFWSVFNLSSKSNSMFLAFFIDDVFVCRGTWINKRRREIAPTEKNTQLIIDVTHIKATEADHLRNWKVFSVDLKIVTH